MINGRVVTLHFLGEPINITKYPSRHTAFALPKRSTMALRYKTHRMFSKIPKINVHQDLIFAKFGVCLTQEQDKTDGLYKHSTNCLLQRYQ